MTPAEHLLGKALAPSALSSAQWSAIQSGLRDRAFFSARVEEARILYAMREAAAAVAAGDLSATDARLSIRDALRRAGYAPPEGKGGTLQDLGSRRRLDLVLKTNADMARGYVQHLESMAALDAFPAQELVRFEQREKPRDWRSRWKAAGGRLYGGGRMIALKTSPIWTALSRFGHPWPPFDFGSGMGVLDVPRDEAAALGLVGAGRAGAAPAPPPAPESYNADLSLPVPFGDVSPEWARLKETFGDLIQKRGATVEWRGNLVRENFESGGAFAMRLGVASPALRATLAARPETAPLAALLESKQQLVVTEKWLDKPRKSGTDHRDHFRPLPEYPDSKPLTVQDIELIPSIWHKPDRAFDAGDNCVCLEIDALEGDIFRLIVRCSRGAPALKTFYRTATPFEEKK